MKLYFTYVLPCILYIGIYYTFIHTLLLNIFAVFYIKLAINI